MPPPARANADIARDILDLAFRLESGRRLPVLTRFEAPITLRLTGRPTPELAAALDRLLARLRPAGLHPPGAEAAPGFPVSPRRDAVPRGLVRAAEPAAWGPPRQAGGHLLVAGGRRAP